MRCALVLYMSPYCCGYRREVATLSPMPYASGRFHRAQIALGREEEMLVSQFTKERFGTASAVAASLECRFGTSYAASDIVMASGVDSAINAFMGAVLKSEDEVIAFAPCGQTYRAIVEDRGARLVEVPLDEETMLPDFIALECALTPRTKLVIVSTPNDASAMAYPEAVADGIAGALFRAPNARSAIRSCCFPTRLIAIWRTTERKTLGGLLSIAIPRLCAHLTCRLPSPGSLPSMSR